MNGLSLCSGIGGLDLAAELAGITVAAQVEIDPAARAVLTKHWPNVPKFADVRTLDGNEFGGIDIIFGGIPCQPYSIAGKRLAERDARDLWPETLRVIREARPRWVLIENVANFARLALDRVWADLEAEGYTVGAVILPACAFGAPHQRERCFTLAYADLQRREECVTPSGSRQEKRPHRHPVPAGLPRLPQPNLGRAVDGIAARLDGSEWPAQRGHPQHPWEASRTRDAHPRGYTTQLKQLGNAVVWQQAYPLFALIEAFDAETN